MGIAGTDALIRVGAGECQASFELDKPAHALVAGAIRITSGGKRRLESIRRPVEELSAKTQNQVRLVEPWSSDLRCAEGGIPRPRGGRIVERRPLNVTHPRARAEGGDHRQHRGTGDWGGKQHRACAVGLESLHHLRADSGPVGRDGGTGAASYRDGTTRAVRVIQIHQRRLMTYGQPAPGGFVGAWCHQNRPAFACAHKHRRAVDHGVEHAGVAQRTDQLGGHVVEGDSCFRRNLTPGAGQSAGGGHSAGQPQKFAPVDAGAFLGADGFVLVHTALPTCGT